MDGGDRSHFTGFRFKRSHQHPLQLFQRAHSWQDEIKDDYRRPTGILFGNFTDITLFLFYRELEIHPSFYNIDSESNRSSTFRKIYRRNTGIHTSLKYHSIPLIIQ